LEVFLSQQVASDEDVDRVIGNFDQRSTLVTVEWSGRAISASLWSLEGSLLNVVLPLGKEHPEIDAACSISIELDSQNIRIEAVVTTVAEVYGSLSLVSFETSREHPAHLATLQRRANSRFQFSPLFPLFCFADHPTEHRIVPFRVVDISNGGVSLTSHRPGSQMLPGTRIKCRFDAPSIGGFTAELIVRSFSEERAVGRQNYVRVAAEFHAQADSARRIISSCLTRPMSSNLLTDLRRENFLFEDWPELIDFSATRESTATSPSSTQRLRPIQIVGRLGDEMVCVFDFADSDENRVSLHFVTSVLDEHRLTRAISEFANKEGRLISPAHLLRNVSDNRLTTKDPRHEEPRAARPRRSEGRLSRVRWDEYAQAYDVMCTTNPAYQNNLDIFRSWINSIQMSDTSAICDVGAGTGNYVLELATRFPNSRVIHLDSDPIMNRTASKKYRAHNVENIEFNLSRVLDARFEPKTLDLIVCINALYTFTDVQAVLDRFRAWLKPAGLMFLLDLGRPMNVADWSKYIIGSSLAQRGIRATLSAFLKGRKAIGQNRLIRREQDRGHYWLHSSEEFTETISTAGFEITKFQTCYREACDLAVCRKID
jgi:ubiquinone/menaquinone biosynthesis C-methylase UbiE